MSEWQEYRTRAGGTPTAYKDYDGDYVVKVGLGTPHLVRRKVFEALFEPAGDGVDATPDAPTDSERDAEIVRTDRLYQLAAAAMGGAAAAGDIGHVTDWVCNYAIAVDAELQRRLAKEKAKEA